MVTRLEDKAQTFGAELFFKMVCADAFPFPLRTSFARPAARKPSGEEDRGASSRFRAIRLGGSKTLM